MFNNILPRDGTASFDPAFLPRAESDALLTELQAALPWREDYVTLYGVRHLSPRLVCWVGDHAYTYSGTRHDPAPWTPTLLGLKARVEAASGARFNSMLANLYRDGRDSVGWHADDERDIGPVIASLSLGATRTFRLRHKRRHLDGLPPNFGVTLTPGSLLVMGHGMQHNWEHTIPKTAKPVGPRINLTFRWLAV